MRPRRRVLISCFACLSGVIAVAGVLGESADDAPRPLLPGPEVLPAPPGNAPGDGPAPPDDAAAGGAAARPSAESSKPSAPGEDGEQTGPLRDPTEPSPRMREILVPPQASPQGTVAGPPPMPQVTLKGRVILSGKPGAAILEVDGKLLGIQAGAETTIAAGSRTGLVTLRVLELSASTLRLEVLPQGQELVLY